MTYTITPDKAMQMLKCSRKTLTNYVADGKLKSERKSVKIYFNEDSILDVLNKRKIKAEITKKNFVTSSSTITEVERNLLAPKIPDAPKKFEYDITGVGYQYVEVCRQQMKDLDIYNAAYEILLYDVGIQYQLYREYLDESYTHVDAALSRLANMHYVNVTKALTELGLTPKAKASIGAKSKKGDDEQDLFSLIAEQLK